MNFSDDLSALGEKKLAEAIVKVEELLAQSNRVFLVGAGCSKCAGLPLTAELTQEVLASGTIDDTTKAILAAIGDNFAGAADANIEDYLSELIDLLAIAERRTLRGATQKSVALGTASYETSLLLKATDQIKDAIARIIEKDVSIQTHRTFVRALHRPHGKQPTGISTVHRWPPGFGHRATGETASLRTKLAESPDRDGG